MTDKKCYFLGPSLCYIWSSIIKFSEPTFPKLIRITFDSPKMVRSKRDV